MWWHMKKIFNNRKGRIYDRHSFDIFLTSSFFFFLRNVKEISWRKGYFLFVESKKRTSNYIIVWINSWAKFCI